MISIRTRLRWKVYFALALMRGFFAFWWERARGILLPEVAVQRKWNRLYATYLMREGCPDDVTRNVGPGWRQIVIDLIFDLFSVGWSGVVYQVKEKYGGLRFYCDGEGRPEIEYAIHRAERRAARTCERCGARGRLMGGSWLATLCDQHDVQGEGK